MEQQLRWFKNQLFGAKSERRILQADPSQLSLGDGIVEKGDTEPEPATEIRGHSRRKNSKKAKEEPGLRFEHPPDET
jgi:transposase